MEQTTEPDQNHEIHTDENPHQISEDDQNSQKLPKEPNDPSDNDTQKTPKNSQNTSLQEEPINNRGEKYNLRPNPNPNYADSLRYQKEKVLQRKSSVHPLSLQRALNVHLFPLCFLLTVITELHKYVGTTE